MNEIFLSATDNWLAKPRGLIRAIYRSDRCREVFNELLGSGKLNSLNKGVLIMAFNLDSNQCYDGNRHWEPVTFSNLNPNECQTNVSLVQLAMCTSATPVYFPSYRGYVDGGLAANNPALIALIQTQDRQLDSKERSSVDEIVLLSFGSGLQPTYLAGESHDWGYMQWARHLIDAMNDGSIYLVDQLCWQLLGVRYHRISPAIPARIKANQVDQHDVLLNIATQANLEPTIEWARRY